MLEQWSPAHHHYCMLISAASATASRWCCGEFFFFCSGGDGGEVAIASNYGREEKTIPLYLVHNNDLRLSVASLLWEIIALLCL